MAADLIVRNAKLRSGERVDIAISDSKYAEIAPNISDSATQELDAAGNLVSESFTVPQLHLDKVYTVDWLEEAAAGYFDEGMGGAMTTIELAAEVKRHYQEDEVLKRMNRALTNAALAGATHVRAFIDIDSKAELKGFKAALRAKEQWQDRLKLQLVAFAQDGLSREPGAEEFMWEAMELGADVVGGIPWIEYTDTDMERHTDITFEMAIKYDKDLTSLVDDAGDPNLRTSEYLAISSARHGWQGRVVASQARASANYNEVYHRKWVELLRQGGVGIVTNPHSGPLHVRVHELAQAGVTLALGGESVHDAYYPFGRCNMLEAAFVSAHALWSMEPEDQELLYDMITLNGAKLMRLPEHRIAVGNEASLVVLQDESVREALTHHREPRYVIFKGEVTAQSTSESRIV
tara:strand:- start:2619 stop:3836 length:1218 start_codon:yes stop_codon:yes gene_type:complete